MGMPQDERVSALQVVVSGGLASRCFLRAARGRWVPWPVHTIVLSFIVGVKERYADAEKAAECRKINISIFQHLAGGIPKPVQTVLALSILDNTRNLVESTSRHVPINSMCFIQ